MSDSDDEENSPPILHVRTLSLTAGANRLKCMPQKAGVVAVWEDSGNVKVSLPDLYRLSSTWEMEGAGSSKRSFLYPRTISFHLVPSSISIASGLRRSYPILVRGSIKRVMNCQKHNAFQPVGHGMRAEVPRGEGERDTGIIRLV
jgi:hypothetical protein